jgi:hypothetical protein
MNWRCSVPEWRATLRRGHADVRPVVVASASGADKAAPSIVLVRKALFMIPDQKR